MPEGKPYHRSLSSRLLLYVILCSTFFTLLSSAMQIYVDYIRDRQMVSDTLSSIQRSYLATVAHGIWDCNTRQTEIQLWGIVSLPDMVSAEVAEWDAGVRKVVCSATSAGTAPSSLVIKTMPLTQDVDGVERVIGELRVTATLDHVRRRVLDRAVVVLATNAVKTFFAALCIFYIFQILVTRHLRRIADYTREMDLEGIGAELVLNRVRAESRGGDEFDTLADAINNLRRRLREDIAKRCEAERSLHESERNLAVTMDSICDAIIVTDAGGAITRMNPVAERITGWEAREAIGHGSSEVLNVVHRLATIIFTH